MPLSEFIKKGYRIYAQEPVIQTEEINLTDLENNVPLDECQADVIDSTSDDTEEIVYDILNPDGDLLSPYDYKKGLTTEQAVRDFIEKL